MKKFGLLVLLMFGFAQVSGTEIDYSKMSINELDSALIRAVAGNSFDEVQTLVAAGANVHGEITISGTLGRGEGCMDYTDVYSLLQYAAMQGYLDILKELIKAGALIHVGYDHGPAALHKASQAGHVDVVRELIKAGADLNYENFGYTVLGIASAKGHVDVVKELIKAGADVNYVYCVKKDHHIDCLKKTALYRASEAGHVDVVRELIKAGADVNYVGCLKETALIEAVNRGYVDVVRELIKAGAHVNLTNEKGDTALMCAIKKHDFDLVQILLQSCEFQTGIWQLIRDLFFGSGAKAINYADKDGNTVLILAVNNILFRYREGNSKEYEACVNSQRIVEELFKFPGIDHHHVNKYGETAMTLLKKLQK
jgi:ankyrin repeat protein